MDVLIESAIPGVSEYCELRVAAGLSARSRDAAARGLPNSLYAVCVRQDERLIGMGRIVGDGGCNYEIVDMAVHPDFQRRGLGTRIMTALMDYLADEAPSSAYVSLIADEGAPALYTRFGFQPTAPASVGMAKTL